jgi:hypothetical protein
MSIYQISTTTEQIENSDLISKLPTALTSTIDICASSFKKEDQLINELMFAINADDVNALDKAIQQLPGLNINLFSIQVVDADDSDAEPISLLGLAQAIGSTKTSAFIAGEGLFANDPESVAAISKLMDEASEAAVDLQHIQVQELTIMESLRPESFADVNELLELASDIEASLGEPCQLRALCKQLCREYMQANEYGSVDALENLGEKLH